MTTLIVTLAAQPPTAGAACDVVLTHDGQAAELQEAMSLALLPGTSSAEVVALVPFDLLSWHQVELPKGTLSKGFFQDGQATKLRAVLGGLLEDRLLDDPNQLHFAIAPDAKAQSKIWVATCDRSWLNTWLAALAEAGRPAVRIVPELTPLDASQTDQAAVYVVGSSNDPKILMVSASGVTQLPLSTGAVALLAWPVTAQVTAEPGLAALAEQHFTGRVVLQTTAQRAMAAARSDWDLAQFELVNTRQARAQKSLSAGFSKLLHAEHWRAARWAAALLVVVNIVGLQAFAMKERSELADKRSAIAAILTSTFPDVRVVVDAPVQMTRAYAQLQQQNGGVSGADLEVMLAVIRSAAPELPAPSAIEFASGELTLRGLGLAADSAALLAVKLQAYGYTAKLEGDVVVVKQASGS